MVLQLEKALANCMFSWIILFKNLLSYAFIYCNKKEKENQAEGEQITTVRSVKVVFFGKKLPA